MDTSQRTKEHFQRDGFLIFRKFCPLEVLSQIRKSVAKNLEPLIEPVELESDLGYPGAPKSRSDEGGKTVRRLLQAYQRGEPFSTWALNPDIKSVLEEIFGKKVLLSQSHHNCIMTKEPRFSSETHWHQDVRYWSFEEPELISVWLAIENEHKNNGCLRCIPGSHLLEVERQQLDELLFLKPEPTANKELIKKAVDIELDAGDVIFFHSKLFHAARRNQSDQKKWSLVYTYHNEDNRPLPHTKSSRYPSIPIISK